MPQPDPKQMTNNQSPITNNQFFVLLFRLDPQRKAFVIGEWLLVNGYLSLADSRGFGLGVLICRRISVLFMDSLRQCIDPST